jgi:Anti-repressor SinI
MLSRNKIDSEWMSLIVEAKKIGLTFQEIRQFLCNERKECLFSHSCPLLDCLEH